MKWEPKDVIAILVIIGAVALLWQGFNGRVGWTLIAVVCAYYGIDLTPFIKLGRNQKAKKEEEAKDNDKRTDSKSV